MKAIIKPSAAPGLELVDRDIPNPGPNEVLVRIEKASICGTDLHIDKWDDWAASTIQPGRIIGHEFIGRVAELGSHVSGLRVGERVSAEGHLVCGTCRNCLGGKPHFCPNTRGIGIQVDGIFAEYAVIPASNIWRVEDSISDEEMSCFDPFGNAVHTALSFDLVGEDVLITGAGPIGCMGAAIAKKAGARHIVVTDINPYRLELAKQMGATRTVNVNKEGLQAVMDELGMREGFDVGLEMSGAPEAFNSMIDHMISGGKIALLGILPNGMGIDWDKVIFKLLTIKGIYGREMYETWYKATVLIQSGLDLKPIITHRFHYTDFREAFDLMHSGKTGKVILNWSST